MCTLDPRIAWASGTYATKLWIWKLEGNLPVFLYLQVVMNKLFPSGGCR